MLASTLYKGEKVFDDSNKSEWMGDGESIFAGGERRLLSRIAPPIIPPSGYADFNSVYSDFPESEWDARIDEQVELEARCSDFCDFPAFDQDGLPTCWAIGTAQAATILRRIMGLPFVQLSGCSLAVPISGGHSGGWEKEANDYAVEHGIASVGVWPENNTNRSLNSKPEVDSDRKNHKVLEFLDMKTKANWVSACLRTKPGPFAYNSMRHVMAMCDVVRIEKGSLGFRVRNSWHDSWGAKNKHGFGGFNVYRATPDSGLIMNQITASPS